MSRFSPAAPKKALIVFLKYPAPGRAKTRLVPALGSDGAAAMAAAMAGQTVALARKAAARLNLDLEVRYTGAGRRHFSAWLGRDLRYRPQRGANLGERMAQALARALDRCPAAVLIGADTPGAGPEHMEKALAALNEAPMVLGPVTDGGYWLIGLNRQGGARGLPILFEGVEWSTGRVLAQTMVQAARLGLTPHLIETLSDVDRPGDLGVWKAARRWGRDFSVVIPTLNEEANLGRTIGRLAEAGQAELIVVDGGSTDRTRSLARRLGARVFQTWPSRARQMALGAAQASRPNLLFLHAETVLPPQALEMAASALENENLALGAFAFGLDQAGRAWRWLERGVNLRSRLLGLPYGDQAFFMRARALEAAGGVPDLAIMEDYELARRMARRGEILIMPCPAQTSARRWQRLGLGRVTLVNLAIVVGYRLGLPPDRLARLYGRRPHQEE